MSAFTPFSFFSEIKRVITPHTSFEELVTAQCQELEDAMIKEVMNFYTAFNNKLSAIRKQHLRSDDLPKKPITPDKTFMVEESQT